MAELNFDDQNFNQEVLESKVPVLVDFWAPWCGPCRVQGPILDEVAKNYDVKNIKIGKLNVDEAPESASRFQVMSIPTIIVFKDGRPIDQMTGIQEKDVLIKKIEELTKK